MADASERRTLPYHKQRKSSPDKRNRSSEDEVSKEVSVRSPKRISNSEFNRAVDKLMFLVRNLITLAPKVAQITDPSKQQVQFKKTTFKDKKGVEHVFEEKYLTQKDFRELCLKVNDDFLKLKALYRNKNSRNSFKVSAFFDPQDRFDGWFTYLNAQNRLVQAGPALVAWLRNENFGSVMPPVIGKDGNPVDPRDAENKATSNGLRNTFSQQLKNGIGIRSIFSLLFFHAIRVATVRKLAGANRSDEPGGHQSVDHRQNYFTQAMRDAFVNSVPLYHYVPAEKNSFKKEAAPEGSTVSTVNHLIRNGGRYEGDKNVIVYSSTDGGRQKGPSESERITPDFVHMTAVQTILNLNISTEYPDEDADDGGEKMYGIAVEDYRKVTLSRDAWRDAFKESVKEKNRKKRKEEREASSGEE